MSFILSHSTEKPFFYSKDKIICKTNESFLNLTGYKHEEIIGKSNLELKEFLKFEDLHHPQNIEPCNKFIIYTKDNVRKEIIISCETLIDQNERVFFIEECQPLEFETIVNNISDDLDGPILLNSNILDKKYDFIGMDGFPNYSSLKGNTNNIPISYASLSYPDFKIIYINKRAYKTIDRSHQNISKSSSIIGRCFFDFFSLSENQKENIISNVYHAIEKEPYIYIANHTFIANGEEIYLKAIFQPIFDINNKIANIIALGVDISDEIQTKKRLALSLKEQEEMFLAISHELKTPLNIIFSASQLLEMNLQNIDSCPQKSLIQRNSKSILENAYRLTKLTNNILDISKIESGFSKLNLQNIDIIKLVEDIVESVLAYTEVRKLKIIFDTNVEEKITACDPIKIERIILNLITNAIKFSDSKGSIYVNVLDKDNFIEISVRDEGIGIDQKHLDSIFQKFIQVKESLKINPKGTGIGLSLVKSIVELHKGTISVESQLGKGSTFKIQLPSIVIEDPVKTDDIPPSSVVESLKFEFSDIYL